MEKESELLTVPKIAERWGVSVAQVKKLIAQANVQPAKMRGACPYYNIEELEEIRNRSEA